MQLGLSNLPCSLGRQGHSVPHVFIVRSNHACRHLAEWVSLVKATVQKAFLVAKAFLEHHWFKGSRLFTFMESQDLGYLPTGFQVGSTGLASFLLKPLLPT